MFLCMQRYLKKNLCGTCMLLQCIRDVHAIYCEIRLKAFIPVATIDCAADIELLVE